MQQKLPFRAARQERCRNTARLGSALMGLALLALTAGLQQMWDIPWITTQRATFVAMSALFGTLALIAWAGAWQLRHTLNGK